MGMSPGSFSSTLLAPPPKIRHVLQMASEIDLDEAKPKGRPQVRRARADMLIGQIIAEAERLNADPTMMHSVARLSVFGSYLTDKPVLGDLDIAVLLNARWDSNVKGQWEAMRTTFLAAHPPAPSRSDYMSKLLWPQLYIFRRLRVGRGMSIHDEEEIKLCGFEMRTIFEAVPR